MRAKVLQQQGGLENERVGRYLNEAAVMVDGGNSKAREEVERAKAEKGVVDWAELEKDGAMAARGKMRVE